MDKSNESGGFYAVYQMPAIDFAPTSKRSYDHSHESTTNKNLGGCEQDVEKCEPSQAALTDVDELLRVEIWNPGEPQYCKAICTHYGVKNRTVQKWFEKIVEVCPWFEVSELRLSDDRYTPLCVELMGDYRASGLIARKWGAKMAERFSDGFASASRNRVAAANAPQPEAPAIRPDVLPPDDRPDSNAIAPFGNFSDTIALPYNVPAHDPNALIPGDIYNPATSSAPRMKRDEADRHIEAYSEMIAAQEVADSGYSFISSIFKAHTSYQRSLGDGFTALRETLSTQRKQVGAATAVVDLSSERLKFGRSVQLNQQANIKLNGETVKTGLIQERMDTEISKLKNEIQGLKTQAQQALLKAQSLELSA